MGSNAASLPPPDLVNKGVPNAPFYLPETIPSAGTAMSSKLFPHNETLPLLYQPIEIGGMTFKNRIQVAPMCQYSAIEGVPTPWHLVHLGGFATRGASLVIAEASAVLPNGRISPQCPGLWNDEQRDAWKPIFDFVKANGARAEIQLISVAREFLRNTDLVFDWAQELGVSVSVPVQYERAHTRMFKHAQLVY